jgi:hypothetical protein
MFWFWFLQGYPGNLIASVTYTLNNEGDLAIHMQVITYLSCGLFHKNEERILTSCANLYLKVLSQQDGSGRN